MSQTLNRRDLIKGALAASAIAGSALSAKSAVAADDKNDHHAHHAKNKNENVVDTALVCMKDGQACLDHCFILLKDGDKEMASCAESVTEMLVMCDGLAKMASYRSPHLKDFAKVCAAVCKDCQDECEKHSDKHVECKQCADSCADCIKACDNIA